MKRTVDELLRLACIHAESDRRGFAICNDIRSPEYIDAMELADAFYKYRMKRWGRTLGEKYEAEADVIDAKTGVVIRKGSSQTTYEKTVMKLNAFAKLVDAIENSITNGDDNVWVPCADCDGEGGYTECNNCFGDGGWWQKRPPNEAVQEQTK